MLVQCLCLKRRKRADIIGHHGYFHLILMYIENKVRGTTRHAPPACIYSFAAAAVFAESPARRREGGKGRRRRPARHPRFETPGKNKDADSWAPPQNVRPVLSERLRCGRIPWCGRLRPRCIGRPEVCAPDDDTKCIKQLG